jgi:flavin reductase (DIM6/NTAB) family NADH-FMN oxidoreductase RutF
VTHTPAPGEAGPRPATADLAVAVDLRGFMAAFPSGVAIISAVDLAGRPWGMTCTSLSSVSLRPAVLLVCLRQGSPTLAAVLAGGSFALNLLRDDARATAELFASGEPDRFARTPWLAPPGAGGPHLHTVAFMTADCRVTDQASHGDHVVVFGQVTRVTERAAPTPLMYGLRRYLSWPPD